MNILIQSYCFPPYYAGTPNQQGRVKHDTKLVITAAGQVLNDTKLVITAADSVKHDTDLFIRQGEDITN